MNKICKRCTSEKSLDNYYKHSGYKDNLRPICITCFKAEKSEYQKKNPNRNGYVQKYNKNFQKEKGVYPNNYRRRHDEMFRLAVDARNRMYQELTRNKWNRTTKFKDYIGCTLDELCKHLEGQFQPGMTWENHSLYGWHIDHIIPLSSAKTPEDLYKLFHYTNLQPLWAAENIKKSNK